jgi:hypothetical protein
MLMPARKGGPPANWNSAVYFSKHMFSAQNADPSLDSPVYPPTTPSQQTAFKKLLKAIGIGIGNTAAHEIGHQLELPDMDCDKPGNNSDCDIPVGFNYEDYLGESTSFFDIGSPMHWTANDLKKLNQVLLQK